MAHIRSILPQRGGVAPVDNNTVFLAHYDEHAYDNLKGLRHNDLVKCFQFNNTGGNEYIQTSLVLPTNGTIEFWYYPFSFYDYNSIFENSISADDWECWIYSNGILKFRALSSGGIQYTLPSAAKWYHIAITWEKTGNTTLIVDGVQRATAATSWVDPGTLTLGGKLNTKTKGKMSDVRVWNYARTPAQIAQSRYNLLGEDTAGIIARWKLDESSGTIAYDYSGNGIDAVVTGGTWVNGKAVYSLVSGGYPGSTGKGVLLEEATNNELTGKSANPTLGGSTVTKLSDYSYVVTTANQAISGINIPFLTNDGIQKTFSGYVTGTPGVVLTIQLHSIFKEITLTGGRDYFFFTSSSTTNPSVAIFTGYGNSPNQVTTFALEDLQVELKPYATSFISGIRESSSLSYLIPMASNPFTISFWAKTNSYSSSYPWYVNMYPSGWADGSNRIFFRPTSNTVIGGGRVVGGTAYSTSSGTVADVRAWHMYAMTSNGTTMNIYQDGVLVANGNSITDLPAGTQMLVEFYGSNPSFNTVLDEVRIDTVARTSTEIAAWYYQGRNGW